MTPKRTCLLLLAIALLSLDCERWGAPAVIVLPLTLAGVLTLVTVPGLIAFGIARRRSAHPLHLIWIATTGPVLLAIVGLAAWLMGSSVRPVDFCKAIAYLWIAAGLVWATLQPADLRFTPGEVRVLAVALLVVVVAAGRSVNSVGTDGELYGGTVTRTFDADGRSDPRVPYLVPMNVVNGWNPFGPESSALYAPYTFASRGPLVGLATTPIVLTWERTPMRRIEQMARPFEPVDRYGYMQYRFTVITIGALSVLPFFVALGGGELAAAGAAMYALTPFFVHELYFTWTKQATVTFLLSAFCLVLWRRHWAAGLLVGLAYVAHPSAAFSSVVFVPLVVAVAVEGDWRGLSIRRLLSPTRWWASRGALLALCLGVVCTALPWQMYRSNKPDPGQPQFISYFYLANNRMPWDDREWVSSRVESLASTVVPFYSFVAHRDEPIVQPVWGTASPVTLFAAQYCYSLPAGLGFVWLVWRGRRLARSLWRCRGFAVLMIAVPTALLWIQWGRTITGLLREGLHAPFAFLVLAWVGALGTAERSARLQIARAVELLAFMWVPTVVSQGAIASRALAVTDLLGFAATVAGVALLVRMSLAAGCDAGKSTPSTNTSVTVA